MLVHSKPSPLSQRKGSIHPILIFLTVIALCLFALVFNQARLWVIRVDLQNNSDASVLAATLVLVDDDLLRGTLCDDTSGIPDLLDRARAEAQLYASRNPVNARQFQLDANPLNMAEGDIVFGTLNTPLSKTLTLATNVRDSANKDLSNINTIRINAHLSQSRGNAPGLIFPQFTGQSFQEVMTRGSATLDRDVVGFRPVVTQPLVLAPLALLADYNQTDIKAWNTQIEGKTGNDEFVFDRLKQEFKMDATGDGLPEFEAVIPLDPAHLVDANVSLLFIGSGKTSSTRFEKLTEQLTDGISKGDLVPLGGALVLNSNNNLTVPGDEFGPSDSTDLGDLQTALESLQTSAAVRIWPLYCGLDSGDPIVCGFVAARVVQVDPTAPGDPLRFTLQPTMISTSAAVTDATQRGINGVPIFNLYICKVRIVE